MCSSDLVDSEFSIALTTLLQSSGSPAGMLIGVPGCEALQRRRADLLALIKAASPEQRRNLQNVIAIFANATTAPLKSDYYIRSLCIDPSSQGRGFGRRLLEQAVHDCLAADCRRVTLDVQIGNVPALRLYESFGFRILKEGIMPQLGFGIYSMAFEV